MDFLVIGAAILIVGGILAFFEKQDAKQRETWEG